MHIYEILNNREIDYHIESTKLLSLFNEKGYFYSSSYNPHSFFDVVESCFRHLPLSGNYITLSEFLKRDEFVFCHNIEDFSVLCEKILSLLVQIKNTCKDFSNINNGAVLSHSGSIIKVINYDLETSGLIPKPYDGGKLGKLIVVYPNDFTIAKAIEAQPDLTESIINYSRPTNKGNLVEKEKCLHFIIKGVEHIAQDKSFAYPKVSEQAETIFNMFHIRHDNINGKKKNIILPNLTDDELEHIFDMGYRLALELLILNEFQNIDSDVDLLRQKMKQRK